MKKQVNKLTVKTDKIVSLSKSQAQNVVGALPARTFSCNQSCFCL